MNDTALPISRRAHARWPVSLPAHLELDGTVVECRVVDLSVGGARIEPALGYSDETPLVLNLLTFGRFPAQIAWTSTEHSGLRFGIGPVQVAEALQAIALYSAWHTSDGEATHARPSHPQSSTTRTAASSAHQPTLHDALAENRDLKASISELRENMETLAQGRRDAVQKAMAERQDEVRQLEGTIAALREALEQENYGKGVAIEQVRAESHDEIQQLKSAVAALREQLEDQRIRHEDSVQLLERHFAHERAQLTETITVLRAHLEQLSRQGKD